MTSLTLDFKAFSIKWLLQKGLTLLESITRQKQDIVLFEKTDCVDTAPSGVIVLLQFGDHCIILYYIVLYCIVLHPRIERRVSGLRSRSGM